VGDLPRAAALRALRAKGALTKVSRPEPGDDR
jgi:hypothetical protein